MENEAEGPKFDLWLPPVPLWLLSGHPERSSPPGRRNTPDPAPQASPHWALMRWTAEKGGVPFPRLLGRSQRSRVVEVTTPSTTEELVPHHAKGAPSNGGITVLGNPPVQRQRWGRQHQSPYHPRLCENHERSLIGGPRKKGVQGGDSMENEAEGPKFDLWLPPVPLWLLSGHPERSSPPQRRNSPSPARKRHPTEPCCGGYRKGVGFPSRASWGAANAPGWWRLPPAPPHRATCAPPCQRRARKRRNHRTGKPTQAAAAVGEATSIPIPPAPLRRPAMPPNWRPP